MADKLLAVWPILDEDVPLEQLRREALAELPEVAARAHVRLTSDPQTIAVRPGRAVPGSGGARHVVVIEAPCEPVDNYRTARRLWALNG